MNPRFYSDDRIGSDSVDISGSEHQHMTKVMRLRAGDSVTLFDGSGIEFDATILDVGRQSTKLRIESSQEVNRELPFELTLGVALPKGDRQQWLVEKCVELGVTRLTPLTTVRGVAQPRYKALQRLERWIVAASKQCRRNRLMQVTTAETVDHFFARAIEHTVLVAHPDRDARTLPAAVATSNNRDATFIAIGPEGGFADEEINQAKVAGCAIVSLGDRILRVETAALAIVASFVFRSES